MEQCIPKWVLPPGKNLPWMNKKLRQAMKPTVSANAGHKLLTKLSGWQTYAVIQTIRWRLPKSNQKCCDFKPKTGYSNQSEYRFVGYNGSYILGQLCTPTVSDCVLEKAKGCSLLQISQALVPLLLPQSSITDASASDWWVPTTSMSTQLTQIRIA